MFSYPAHTTPSLLPSALNLVVHMLAAPSQAPPATTLVPRRAILMPDLVTTEFPALDHLIVEVELVKHINVLIDGDITDVEAKIDDPTTAEDSANDHA
ncbi:hypothetical protein Ancab_029077 [Ancistrocladus abbreviatus]